MRLCTNVARGFTWVLLVGSLLGYPAGAFASGGGSGEERTSRISDEAVLEIDPDAVPQRPRPILDFGNGFLKSGPLDPGVVIFGGPVWQPSLLGYGTFRSAFQTFNTDETTDEWANRLDFFLNLQLTGTERFLFGVRALDVDPATGERDLNTEIESFFFEGDFGEIFTGLDKDDSGSVDWGFSVGRQPLIYQEGLLINDSIDAVGVIRNTLSAPGGSDFQMTFIYGGNNIRRNDNLLDDDAKMLGAFFAWDYPVSTWNADFAYIFDTEMTDGVFGAISAVQRLGHVNTAFRLLASHALDEETTAVRDGVLLFGEVAWTPAWTHDLFYVNAFVGIDDFTSAARDVGTGGPLGRTGILFASVGLGNYGAPLGNQADDSVGGAVGYQFFFDDTRRQVIAEAGARVATETGGEDSYAVGTRFLQAFGRHLVLQLDAFSSWYEIRDNGWGGRVELRVVF